MAAGAQDAGVRNVHDVPRLLAEGSLRFELRSSAAQVRIAAFMFTECTATSRVCAVRRRRARPVLLREEVDVGRVNPAKASLFQLPPHFKLIHLVACLFWGGAVATQSRTHLVSRQARSSASLCLLKVILMKLLAGAPVIHREHRISLMVEGHAGSVRRQRLRNRTANNNGVTPLSKLRPTSMHE